jgi:hypothetical protein
MRTITLFGPPLSGKTTILEVMARASSAKVKSEKCGDESTGFVMCSVDIAFDSLPIRLITIPGEPWSMNDWDELLRASDAIMLIIGVRIGIRRSRSHGTCTTALGILRRGWLSMKTAPLSMSIGLAGSLLLAAAATYTSSPIAQRIARPFALLGFVVVNRHQGSLLFSMAAMFVVFSAVAWLFIAAGYRLLKFNQLR